MIGFLRSRGVAGRAPVRPVPTRPATVDLYLVTCGVDHVWVLADRPIEPRSSKHLIRVRGVASEHAAALRLRPTSAQPGHVQGLIARELLDAETSRVAAEWMMNLEHVSAIRTYRGVEPAERNT